MTGTTGSILMPTGCFPDAHVRSLAMANVGFAPSQ